MDQVESMDYMPVGTQSMATDPKTGSMYWAAFTAPNDVPACHLVRIDMTEDWVFTVSDMGQIANKTELVGLYVDPDPISDKAPATPTGLTVTPGAGGANSAQLSWTNPSATRGGAPLSNVSAKIYANDNLVETVSNCTPGAKSTYKYTTTQAGSVIFSVAAVADSEEGARAYADEVFVGTDRPGPVGNLRAHRADESNYDITVSWDAPAIGAQGGWINTSQLTYKVVRRPDGKVIAEGTKSTSVTDNSITDTGGYIYDVTPSTAAGEGVTASTEPCVSGPAIVPPYRMNLSDEADANLWIVTNGDKDEYMWELLRNWGGDDTSFRYYPVEKVGGEADSDDWLISPAFRLEAGKYYAYSYDLRLWGDLFPATYTVNLGRGIEPASLTQVLDSQFEGINDMVWETRSIPFTVNTTGDYHIGFGVLKANPVEIKGVYLREIARTDLSAESLTGSAGASTGKPSVYSVTVTNCGFEAVNSYTVSLVDAAGTVLASRTINESLAPMASAKVEIEWTPADAGKYALRASVTTDGDTNADNNMSAPLSVRVYNEGQWHEIADGKTFTAFAPFYLHYNYSGAQTIYSAQEMGATPASIMGIEYYYAPMGTPKAVSFDAKIAMANTQVSDFESAPTLSSELFTTVYEGTITLDPTNSTLTLLFDTPFAYSGGNLCIQSQHSAADTGNMLFNALSSKNAPKVTALYYSETAPYDFTHNAGAQSDRPNISLFMTSDSGVEAIDSDAERVQIAYERESGTLRLSRESVVRVYSLQGVLLLQGRGTTIDVSSLSGAAIVVAGPTALKMIL